MSCIFLNQFILHGNNENNEFDASKKLILSHTNVFEKEWGATVGNLYVEDGDAKDITSDVTLEVDQTDDNSKNFEIVLDLDGKRQLKLLSNKSLDIHDDRRHRVLNGNNSGSSSGSTFNIGEERVGLPGNQQPEEDAARGFQDYDVIIKCSYKGGSPANRTVRVRANERYIELVIRSWRDIYDRGWKEYPIWYYYINTHFGTRIRFDNFGAWIQRNTKAKNVPNADIEYVYIHLHPDIIRNWLWISDRDHIDSRRERYSNLVYGLWHGDYVSRTSGSTNSHYAGAVVPAPQHGLNATNDDEGHDIAWTKVDGGKTTHCTFADEPYGNGNPIKIDGKQGDFTGKGHLDWHDIMNTNIEFKNNSSDPAYDTQGWTQEISDYQRGIGKEGDNKYDHKGDRFGGNRWQGRFRWAPGRVARYETAYEARYANIRKDLHDIISIGAHNYYNINDLQWLFYFKDDDEGGNVEVYKDPEAYVFRDDTDHSKGTKTWGGGGWSVTRNDLYALLGQLKQKFGHPENLEDSDDESKFPDEQQKFKRGDVWRIYPNMNFRTMSLDGGDDKTWKGRTAPRSTVKANASDKVPKYSDEWWELCALKQNYETLEFKKDEEGDYLFDAELIFKEFDSNKYNDGNLGMPNYHDNGPTLNFGQLWKMPVGNDDSLMNTYNYDWKIESTKNNPEVAVWEYDTDEDLGPDRKEQSTSGSTVGGAEHYSGSSNMELNMYIGNPRIVKTAEGFAEPGWFPGGEGQLKKPGGGVEDEVKDEVKEETKGEESPPKEPEKGEPTLEDELPPKEPEIIEEPRRQ